MSSTMFVVTADEGRCIDYGDNSFGGHVPIGIVGFDGDVDAGPG